MSDDIHEVGADEREALIAWLGDTPETVQCVTRLRRGIGLAWVSGRVEAPEAAVVVLSPGYVYPIGFGENAGAIWALLGQAEGWEAVDVPLEMGGAMAAVVARETGATPVLFQELFYVLDRPVEPAPHAEVRLLTTADAPMMEAATELPGMAGWRLGSARTLVEASVAAGAVVRGQLAAVSFMGSWSARLGEVGITTRPEAQGRGLATAAAALVIAEVQARGLTPAWVTSEENVASRRVAAKLGFREVSRRVYVNRV